MLSRRNELLVTVITESVTFNIRDVTLHSTCKLSIKRKRKKIEQEKTKKLTACNYLIVDEVSMMNCKNLVNLHKNLDNAKSNEAKHFDEFNVIFMSDFLQISFIFNLHLYVNKQFE